MTEQTPAAPGAAKPDPAPIAPQIADDDKTAADAWNEFEAADSVAEKQDDTLPAEPQDKPEGDAGPQELPPVETPSATPADAGTADIWANATPEQKAAFEAAVAARKEFQIKFQSSATRASTLARKIAAAQNTPSRETTSARDHIAGIKDDYPEVVEPFSKALDSIEGKLDHLTKAEQSALEADKAEYNEIVEGEKRRLLEKHPDYADVLKQNAGPDGVFARWIDDQPSRIRAAARRNADSITDSDGAIEVIHEFKKHLGLIKEPPPAPAPAPPTTLNDRRQRQIEGSASPQRSGGRPTVSGIPEDGDPQAIWDAFEAQDNARA